MKKRTDWKGLIVIMKKNLRRGIALICLLISISMLIGCGDNKQTIDESSFTDELSDMGSDSNIGDEAVSNREDSQNNGDLPQLEELDSNLKASDGSKEMTQKANASGEKIVEKTISETKNEVSVEASSQNSSDAGQSVAPLTANASAAESKSEVSTSAAENASSSSGSNTGSSKKNNSPYQDGTYTASAEAYNGPISVAVTISDGQMSKVIVTDSIDDEPYLTDSKSILKAMVNKQTANVDVVTGATVTCDGIIKAVKKALSKAAL